MLVFTAGGLCNRLRVIFSYYREAREKNVELTVLWETSKYCPGHFLEYFSPVPGITYIDTPPSDRAPDYSGVYVNPNYPEPDYSLLQLLPYLQHRVFMRRQAVGRYVAVHVRRTDHIKLARRKNQYTSNAEFFRFIYSRIKTGAVDNVYVATDDADTYRMFQKRYGPAIKFEYHAPTYAIRQTSLADSITDLYMCVYADEFMGSRYSSFSDLIATLRNLKHGGNNSSDK